MSNEKKPDTAIDIVKFLGIESPSQEAIAALKKLPQLRQLEQNSNFIAYQKKYGTPPIDNDELKEVYNAISYLDFVIQDAAEDGGISPDEWEILRQQICQDTGVNITLPGITGKRGDGKYGAMAGGLGEKLYPKQLEALEKALKNASENDKATLLKKIYEADNVKYENNDFQIETNPEQIRINTLTRESFEELGESIIARYLSRETDIENLFKEALGKEKEFNQVEKDVILEIKTAANKYNSDGRNKAEYKKSIEPLLAKFLKTTKTGEDISAEFTTAVKNGSAYQICDRTFSSKLLKDYSDAKEQGQEAVNKLKGKRCSTPHPVSRIILATSYNAEVDENSMIANLINFASDVAQNPDEVDLLVETKGFEYNKNPETQAVKSLAKIMTGSFTYPHEAFVNLKMALEKASEDPNYKLKGIISKAVQLVFSENEDKTSDILKNTEELLSKLEEWGLTKLGEQESASDVIKEMSSKITKDSFIGLVKNSIDEWEEERDAPAFLINQPKLGEKRVLPPILY